MQKIDSFLSFFVFILYGYILFHTYILYLYSRAARRIIHALFYHVVLYIVTVLCALLLYRLQENCLVTIERGRVKRVSVCLCLM